MSKTQSKTFVWKHKAIARDLVALRKKGLEFIVQLYCYWTHDNYNTNVSLNAWFDAMGVCLDEMGITKDDGEPYSLSYLRIYTGKVKTVCENGYTTKDIKSIKKLEEMVLAVNGTTDKKEMSELDKVLARIDKLDTRTQRAVYNRLAKKFG